ncbi:MAG: putative alpha/beta-fold hydrolase [Maribacter sp.]|jgi:predicted alpha/beta-fold hydrolase
MNINNYQPSFLLKNGHFNTIYPSLFRKQEALPFQRKRINTPDDDFLDLDLLQNGHRRVAVLCHGLEGSSSSKYIVGVASLLHQNNWDIVAMNYRSCSEEMNKQVRVYHSGATDDLHTVINFIEKDYDEIVLVGFSLGGNLSLVYAGQEGQNINPKIKAVATASVPTNLLAGSLEILKKRNFIYHRKFLVSLRNKVKIKSKDHPHIYNEENLNRVKTLYDFDDIFTGPIGGFKDAKDYYTQCSSGQFIPKIKIPTLIINALDDPFLPKECYPYEEVKGNECVNLMTPKYGGHVGFVKKGSDHYWSEEIILRFLEGNIP